MMVEMTAIIGFQILLQFEEGSVGTAQLSMASSMCCLLGLEHSGRLLHWHSWSQVQDGWTSWGVDEPRSAWLFQVA